jgi:hypothetical protein
MTSSRILLFATATVLTVFAHRSPAIDSAPPGAEVARCFAAFKRALQTQDGNAAASLASAATLADYERAREVAIDAPGSDPESLAQIHVILAFRFRSQFGKAVLHSIRGRTFAWAVDNKFVTQPSLAPIELDQVRIEGKLATATLLHEGVAMPEVVLTFEWREGSWRVAWSTYERIIESQFADMRKRSGMSKSDLAKSVADLRRPQTSLTTPPSPAAQRLLGELQPRCPIPGTSMSLVPCFEMQPASNFIGLECPKRSLIVIGTELPTPLGGDPLIELERAFTADAFRSQGVLLGASERITVQGTTGLLFIGSQSRLGIGYRKYVVILPGKSKFTQIQVSLPMDGHEQFSGAILAMLHSIRNEAGPAPPLIQYELALPDSWKLAKQFAVVDIYSRQGTFPMAQGGAALFVLNMNETVDTPDRIAFVRRKNSARNHFSQLQTISTRDLAIDNCRANFSYVSAIDDQSGENVVLQYCYIFLPNTTYLVESRRGPEMTDRLFEEVALSWRRRPARQ